MENKTPHCPKCDSTDLYEEKRGYTLTTGVFGMNKKQFVCKTCGAKFAQKKAVYHD